MASLEPVIVHIEKPAETLLSEYFVEMRIWLDAHSITPTDFRLIGGPIVGLEVRFSSPKQAALFARKFGPKDQPTTVVPVTFADLAASQTSMTRTISASDQSVSDTPAAIAGVTRRL
jgi:hypothetical protein